MTDVEFLLLKETLKSSFQVSEYKTNFIGEEHSTHYKMSRKKLISFVNDKGLKVKLVDDYPMEMEYNVCYVQRTGKMVWLKLKD